MNFFRKSIISLMLVLPLLLLASSPCNTIIFNGSTYTFQTSQNSQAPANCTGGWRVTPNLSEDYTFCWVFSDGSYVRTPGYITGNLASSGPNTSITPSQYQYPATSLLVQSTVSNRYGDDNDKKRVIGGWGTVPANTPLPAFSTFTLNQSNMTASVLTQIQTDHGNTEVAKANQLLLILTVNNDHIENIDSNGFVLNEPNYVLRLYHKNMAVNYGFIAGETAVYPSDTNKYFAFAPLNTSLFTYGTNLQHIKNWSIQNTFQGHEKNVYCLLNVPNLPGINDDNRVLDTFVAILTRPTSSSDNTPLYVAGSESKLPIAIGKSHDPNVIEVNIDSSMQCGPDANGIQEELEYTVHFQNIGSADENIVEVNLDLDPHLDNNTLTVTEIGIGTQSVIQNSMPQQAASYSNIGNFDYVTNQPNPGYLGTRTGNVAPDARFRFSGITLRGISAPNIEDSKGYIKFKIKTASAYQTINNQAGIFFGNNPEIVTNLAVTTCVKGGMNCDSCNQQLTTCYEQLKYCKNNSNGWMSMLGWIIAGIELLMIVYLLSRKQK